MTPEQAQQILNKRPADTSPEWKQWATSELAIFRDSAEAGEFKAFDGVRLHYLVWKLGSGSETTESVNAKGWVLISPGRVEPAIKYQELALEFAANGYSVAVIDHRGQGRSQRLTRRREQGHVQFFSDYVTDFAYFVDVLEPEFGELPCYLVGHSMGGAIAALYLVQHSHPFRRAALSAPMTGINTAPWPKWIGRTMGYTGDWINRKLSKKRHGYVVGHKNFEFVDFAENQLTQSQSRYDFMMSHYRDDPLLKVGGVTWRWLAEALDTCKALPLKAPRVEIPVLVLQAGADEIVELEPQRQFASLLPHQESELKLIEHSRHEILMETDEIREPAVTSIIQWFETDAGATPHS